MEKEAHERYGLWIVQAMPEITIQPIDPTKNCISVTPLRLLTSAITGQHLGLKIAGSMLWQR